MLKINRTVVWLPFLLITLLGCEENGTEAEPEHPLTGTYTLLELLVNTDVTSNVDTTFQFVEPQDGDTAADVSTGDLVLVESLRYLTTDLPPISGTAILNADGSATLSGELPVNISLTCFPQYTMIPFYSDGFWTADTSTGEFTIDLVQDALDIAGNYLLEEQGDRLSIIYSSVSDTAKVGMTRLLLDASTVAVQPLCLPATTETERTLIFQRES